MSRPGLRLRVGRPFYNEVGLREYIEGHPLTLVLLLCALFGFALT